MPPLPEQRDRACFIVGCGPSVATQDLSLLACLPVYSCNRVWRFSPPRLDVYYWSDQQIWKEHKDDIVCYVAGGGRAYCYDVHPEFVVGEKVAVDVQGRGLAIDGPIRTGHSAAHSVANFAWRDGYRVFYLVGIDLQMHLGKRYAWTPQMHRDDIRQWNEHYSRSQLERWLSMASWVDGAGGRVISCSPRSLLNDHLPKATLEFAAATHGATLEGVV